jgi:DNA-binding IclR family transcriptional regulator
MSDLTDRERVLQCLSPRFEWTAAEVMRRTNLPAGTVYPILYLLETVGTISSRWEALVPYPRNRLYKLVASK